MIENKKSPLSKKRRKYFIDIYSILKEDSGKKLWKNKEKTTTSENAQNNLNNENQVYQKEKKKVKILKKQKTMFSLIIKKKIL